jgi:glycosyltransferase involved in cell wall biosynthesis
MRIVQIAPYYPPHLGGMENTARKISEHLAKKGHKVEVFTSYKSKFGKKLQSTKNVKINYLKTWEFGHTPVMLSLFSKLMHLSKNSIVHVHATHAFTPEVVYLVSKLKGFNYVVHLHGEIKPTGKLGFLLSPYQKSIFKRFLKKASKIIVLTEEYKNFFANNYKINKEKIRVVPNGLNESFLQDRIKKSSHKSNLLYVGRLSKEKNVDVLIKAISLLKNKIIFNIVGDGEKRKEMEDLIRSKNLNNVIMKGRKNGKTLLNLYKKSDIFLLASNSEGLPTVVLEAMASGIPVIASNVRGIRELVKNNGILVDPPTPENFAKEINKLIENKRLSKKLSKLGKIKARKFNWNKSISKLESIYKEVLNENKSQ